MKKVEDHLLFLSETGHKGYTSRHGYAYGLEFGDTRSKIPMMFGSRRRQKLHGYDYKRSLRLGRVEGTASPIEQKMLRGIVSLSNSSVKGGKVCSVSTQLQPGYCLA